MNKKIIAFGGSSSSTSVNKTLATYAAEQLEGATVEVLDLNDFEMPIYSSDKENENGIPELAHAFKNKIEAADGIIMSFAEHNGNFSAAYKNIYDWVSRIEMKVWGEKPLLIMATSPGKRGGASVLEIAHSQYGRSNPNVVDKFSLPEFYQNFNAEAGITDASLKAELLERLEEFQAKLNQ